ncbi:MAG: hypothetical protein ACI85Z_001244, partial [Rheinheimera aquimaris]
RQVKGRSHTGHILLGKLDFLRVAGMLELFPI